jgi:caa(3)-type oxidase subunit IV
MSEEAHDHHPSYVKIWATLVVLLVISVLGPMLEVRAVTLITAFGIAVVKAWLVAKHFMHVTLEKRFISYAVLTCLVFMFLFFAGAAPDVMKASGSGWEKEATLWNPPAVPSAHGEGGAGHGGGEHH